MMSVKGKGLRAALLLAACGYLTPVLAVPLSCDDGIKTVFRPDAETTVVAVRLVKKGERLSSADDGNGGDAKQASSYSCR